MDAQRWSSDAVATPSRPTPRRRPKPRFEALKKWALANVPAAALSVKLAQEEVQKAKQLMEDGDNKRAELILMRAQADAELALAQARDSRRGTTRSRRSTK